jgi:hypothetical protein
VWIREHVAGFAPVNAMRRAIQRRTRLRWLGGVRSATASWDAYEAPPGQPLRHLAPHAQPWAAVRQWLRDLATELELATSDGAQPAAITLGHVWIAHDGHAILLDEPWNDEPAPSFDTAPRLLHAVVARLLDPVTLPVYARDFLARLEEKSATPDGVARELESLCARPAQLSRWRRAASLLAVPACFLLIWFPGSLQDTGAEEASAGMPAFYTMVLRWLAPAIAAGQCLSLLLFSVTPGQRLWRFGVVDAAGRDAARGPMLWRWLLAWWPVAVVEFFAWRGFHPGALGAAEIALVFVLTLGWLAGLAATIAHPACGPHDRLAGTHLVPR